jgi:hypothetical protein
MGHAETVGHTYPPSSGQGSPHWYDALGPCWVYSTAMKVALAGERECAVLLLRIGS